MMIAYGSYVRFGVGLWLLLSWAAVAITAPVAMTATNPAITPIEHASLLLTYAPPSTFVTTVTGAIPSTGIHLYSDPVDAKGRGLFDKLPLADVIVITHSHSDHLQPSTVKNLTKADTKIVAPSDVALILIAAGIHKDIITVLGNGESITISEYGLTVNAVPMYNTGPNPHHPKDKWNGYVIQAAGKQTHTPTQEVMEAPASIYLSGDTSFIPEMKNNFGFKDRFGHAFLCMNLPYTMGVDEAANATAAFRPLQVTPYHYRNADSSLSNITKYKQLVEVRAPDVNVELMNFYPFGPIV